MKRHYCIIKGIVLLAAMLLAACSSSDSDDSPIVTSQNEICLTTNVNSMPSGTRATTIDNNNALQDYDLKIDAYFNGTVTKYLNGAKLNYDADAWKFWDESAQIHYYWPIEGSIYDPASSNFTVSSLDFVGFCPYAQPGYISSTSYTHDNGISFTANMASYMTNTAQASVSEFLVGLTQNQTYATQTTNNGVPLNFKHPFSRIMYKLSTGHPDITIHSITLKSLKTGGSYTLSPANPPSWTTSLSGSADLVTTLTDAAAKFNNNTTEKPIGSQLIVIPQDFAGAIEIRAEQNGDTETLSTTLSSTTWQAGYSYTYTFTINFPQKELIVNTTKYTEQW